MDWKETILTKARVTEILLDKWSGFDPDFDIDHDVLKLIKETQAEISYKAGRDSFLDDVGNVTIPLSEAHKAGRREVVGWLDKPCPHTGGLEEQQMRAVDCPKCWEDAKKEWGIK